MNPDRRVNSACEIQHSSGTLQYDCGPAPDRSETEVLWGSEPSAKFRDV